MTRKILVIVLVASVVINLAAVLTFGFYWWGERGPRRGFPPRPKGERPGRGASLLQERLNLTEEQIRSIDANSEEMRSKTSALRERLSEKRKDLTALLGQPELDRGKADAILEEISTMQTELEVLAFENLREIGKILTPGQMGQFLELYERRLRTRPVSREGLLPPGTKERPGRRREGGKIELDDR